MKESHNPDEGVEKGTLENTTEEDSKVSFSPFPLKPRELLHTTAGESSARLREGPLDPRATGTQTEDSVLGCAGWGWAKGCCAWTVSGAPH